MSLIEFSHSNSFLMNKGVIVYNLNLLKLAIKDGVRELTFSTDRLLLPITDNTYFHLRKRNTSLLKTDSSFMYFSLLNRIKDIRMSPPAIIDICDYAYNYCESFMKLYNNIIDMLSSIYTIIHDCKYEISRTINISSFKQKIPLDANIEDLFKINIWDYLKHTPNFNLINKSKKPILIFLFNNEILANNISAYLSDKKVYPITFLNRT